MQTASAFKPKRNPHFAARLLPDGYVLIYSEQSTWVHTLTPLGGLVWEFCDGENAAHEIAGIIRSTALLETKDEDVCQLIKELQEKDLLVADDN